jgi:hypothetical protein
VVNMLHQGWEAEDYASPGTSAQFGPFTTAAAIIRLVRVRAVFSTSQPGIDLSPTATIRDQICWGVQSGHPGYTPEVLPADIGGFSFYWSEMLGGDTVASAAWAPASGDFGWADTRVATREWRGQLPIGENQDFYVTAGVITIGAAAFAASMSLEVDYSTP